ncbi:MAG: phage shock protein PspA [Gammaproteobacteria bacterium]|jgi:phage shock protein A|nr:phage shock protein PspA [Gammaproteobacteria bacterium]MBT3725043.1 phage shock protein PspA [Gammaproteobacteria bacterium]MBT4078698.1 phage shock protein PspA [Gammaproteobacteria bacterium]MBT4195905.1 phage shock protein PspA [Gammaproteobacteria bacterium]MBT4451486.1 phage shock protein PspA [Gammaproteobacteria bacterium]
MGIFSRLNDIVNSNINVMLDKAEDPEKIIRLVIQEMEDTLVEVRSDAARTIADKKKLRRRIDLMGREVREWERKAELAISKAREDLARAALTEKHNLERDTDILEGDLQELELHLTKLNEDIGQLQQKLDDAKNRHKAMVLKHDTVSNRLRTRSKLHDNRIDDALGRFEGIEEKIDQMEGKVDAFDIGKDRSLQDQFAELESEDVIDDELEKLKARLKEKSE